MSFPEGNPPGPAQPEWPVTPPPPAGAYPPPYQAHYPPQDPLRLPAPYDAPYAQPWVPSDPPTPRRMPKAQALHIAGRMKRWLIVGSVLSFGVLIGLVSHNVVGVTAAQSAPSVAAPDQLQQPEHGDDGGFFDNQGGFGFGSNGPSQAPVTQSGVS